MDDAKNGFGYAAMLFRFALMLLILPFQWILSAATAAAVHELGHYIAVWCFGGSIDSMRIRSNGAIMQTAICNSWQKLICLLAGPAAGLILSMTAPVFPMISLCAIVQSLYNLLPIYPLDGGRVLRIIMELLDKDIGCCIWIERLTVCILLVMVLYITHRLRLGIAVLLYVLCLISQLKPGKIPCKS